MVGARPSPPSPSSLPPTSSSASPLSASLPPVPASTVSVLPQICMASIACSACIIEFTIPQIVRLSQSSANTSLRLPACPLFPTRMALQLRQLPTQSLITVAQFCAVRELRNVLDTNLGPSPLNLSLAYGAASVPLIAGKYNMITGGLYRYHNLMPPSKNQSWADAVRHVWTKKIQPGLVWSYLRDTGSIGGAIVLSPFVTAHLSSLSSSSSSSSPPSPAFKFAGGLLTGSCTGLATQLFHNAALDAGRRAETGDMIGSIKCLTQLLKTQGLRAFYLNFHLRVGVIAGWSAILNVADPFRTFES